MLREHNVCATYFFEKVKFIDGIDKNGTCSLLHSFMPTIVIPLNEVYGPKYVHYFLYTVFCEKLRNSETICLSLLMLGVYFCLGTIIC